MGMPLFLPEDGPTTSLAAPPQPQSKLAVTESPQKGVRGAKPAKGSPNQQGVVHKRTRRPGFKWTPELHQRFEAAVNVLGPTDAKPRAVLKLMQYKDLNILMVKSHLQKYLLKKKEKGSVDAQIVTVEDVI